MQRIIESLAPGEDTSKMIQLWFLKGNTVIKREDCDIYIYIYIYI